MGFPVGYSEMMLPRVLLQVLLLLGLLHRFLLWAFHAVGLGDLGVNYPLPASAAWEQQQQQESAHGGEADLALQHRRPEFRPVPAVLIDEALPVVRFAELAGTATAPSACAASPPGTRCAGSATAATRSTAGALTVGWRTTSAPARSAARRSSPGTSGPPRRGPSTPATSTCRTRRRCRRCPRPRFRGRRSCCSTASSELPAELIRPYVANRVMCGPHGAVGSDRRPPPKLLNERQRRGDRPDFCTEWLRKGKC